MSCHMEKKETAFLSVILVTSHLLFLLNICSYFLLALFTEEVGQTLKILFREEVTSDFPFFPAM